MPIEIGQLAPDFALRDQDGLVRGLADHRGRRHVLLVFYVLAFSEIDAAELCELRDDPEAFGGGRTATLAVSVDSPYAARVFADREGLNFPLLSDFWPHGEVARRYGVFNEERGFANRGTFVIDAGGVVRWAIVNRPGEPREAEAYRKALAELPAPPPPSRESA
ncbi:MAG TPA: peroxiredoxin [Actinomycetes bacterium]|nr:peroxiredoxin [Actinomycetes bacterium]